MATWGLGLRGRVPGRDDGDWKALRAMEPGPNGANEGRLMWFNIATRKHRWEEVKSKEDLHTLHVEYHAAQLAAIDDIAHEDTVTLVHSFAHSEAGIEDSDEYGSAAADNALIAMRAFTAEESGTTPGPPPNEPGVWRCCYPDGWPLRDMKMYAAKRKPHDKCPVFGTHEWGDNLSPKNGTHVDNYMLDVQDYTHPQWKKEVRAANNTKVWRCIVDNWTEDDRRLLHELARGLGGWGSKIGKDLPSVKRGAVRVKGYPWRTPASTEGSQLEGLFVFDGNKRAGTLGREVLDATWTPVAFTVWEEEIWHYGIFDVVFERDAYHNECPAVLAEIIGDLYSVHSNFWCPDEKRGPHLKHCRHTRRDELPAYGPGAHGGKAGRLDRDVVRYPLTKPETYAMLLLEQMCFRAHTVRHHLKFYAEQLASRKRTAEAANMSSCSGASTSAASDELPTLQLPGELLQRTDETSMLTSVIYGAQHGTPGSSSDM